MSSRLFPVAATFALSLALCMQGFAQDLAAHKGMVVKPPSSLEKPEDIGIRAHTNFEISVPKEGVLQAKPQTTIGPPVSGYWTETPASIACIYSLPGGANTTGCDPNVVTAVPAGGSKAIAIVDAYDNPTATSDLAAFSAQFGLPTANFEVVYGNGVRPPTDSTGGWEIEESLDVQWAHAMAPNAKIYLVEAYSNSDSDLFASVQAAGQLVANAGGGEVSMSWGGSEFCQAGVSCETQFDPLLTKPNVVYFASAGDQSGVSYPAASPNVVSVGGTSLHRKWVASASSYEFVSEGAWRDTGGGVSQYEKIPSYQSAIPAIKSKLGGFRGTPDVAAIADPNNAVWVLSSDSAIQGCSAGCWFFVGGTSAAAPIWAGIVNAAGTFNSNTNAELTEIYGDKPGTDLKDTTKGFCGLYNSDLASTGYDFCTGLGSPLGIGGK